VVTLGALAAQLGLEAPSGAGEVALRGLASLASATPGTLAFMTGGAYLDQLRETRASCVILQARWADASPVPVLVCDDPYLMYARASRLFPAAPAPAPGIHERACVDPSAILGRDVHIGAGAVVEAGARLGDGVVVGSSVSIGADAEVGARTRLYPGVVLYHGVRLGRDCIVHGNTVIGADGFGYARGPDGWEKIHQFGSVSIGDGVEIGASVTIDRGALEDTLIADGVIIDDQVHVGHNCSIGPRTALAGCPGVAGSTTIGADCTLAGMVGVSGHLEICDNAHFTGQARIGRSILEPGSYSSGTALDKTVRWRRNAVRFRQLDTLEQRVRALEAALHEQEPNPPEQADG